MERDEPRQKAFWEQQEKQWIAVNWCDSGEMREYLVRYLKERNNVLFLTNGKTEALKEGIYFDCSYWASYGAHHQQYVRIRRLKDDASGDRIELALDEPRQQTYLRMKAVREEELRREAEWRKPEPQRTVPVNPPVSKKPDSDKLYEVLALAYVAAERCPTQKVSSAAVAVMLLFAGEKADGNLGRKIDAKRPQAETVVRDYGTSTFCTATWAMYGPQGADAPGLLYGFPR
jgi:hypothetical protein